MELYESGRHVPLCLHRLRLEVMDGGGGLCHAPLPNYRSCSCGRERSGGSEGEKVIYGNERAGPTQRFVR